MRFGDSRFVHFFRKTFGQTVAPAQSFERVEMRVADGEKLCKISVRARLEENEMIIESTKPTKFSKQ